MQELPLAIQMKLRAMPGAESGVQVVEALLEDGRLVPDVTIIDCTYVEDNVTFAAEMVADVRLPARPPSVLHFIVFIGVILAGIAFMFYLIRRILP
ncbi:MAG TPA: hypothetical protein VNN18_04770 [Candidatus Xenobia bacterium]|nr:hypothetical protein [Candidatus Xenobia bacterium]